MKVILETKTYKKDDIIYSHNDLSDKIYLIESGEVKILSKHFKNLNYTIVKRDNFRPKRGTLSIKKAKKLLKFKPNYNLEKGIKKYIDFINSIKKSKFKN